MNAKKIYETVQEELNSTPANRRHAETNNLPSTSAYSKALQGSPLNALIASSTAHGGIQINAITHEGTIQSGDVLITIDEEVIKDITPQTFKVLILILTTATAQLPHADAITAEAIDKGRTIQIPLARYMEACKIKDVKEGRAQLNRAINALYGVSFDWTETRYETPDGKSRKVKIKKPYRMRLLGVIGGAEEENGKPVKRGVAEVKLEFDMAKYLSGAYIMPYPDALLTINTHYHPYSVPLGWKLCTLHNMNFGKDSANITTVKTLLSAAQGLPRYMDLVRVGKIYERLICPFDRDLAALVEAGILSAYWYYDNDGNRIESAQLGGLSYTAFSELHIHYELKDYPDQTPRIEAKSKRIKAAISRQKNAAQKKAEQESAQKG